MGEVCLLNGEILPLERARISPLDRGFIFGDSLYEVFKILGGTILHLDPHLERLRIGLEQAEIPEPAGLVDDCRRLVEAARVERGSLYLQISRGTAPRAHVPPFDLVPTVFMYADSHDFTPPASRGMKLVSAPDWRWRRCDLKSTSLMGTVLGKLEVRQQEADEVLFVGPQGDLREGGSVNFFVRRRNALETFPLADKGPRGRVLAGVTRGALLDLARAEGYPVHERAPRMEERGEWQEAFVSGTLTGVQPVVSLDGESVGAGICGDWTRRLAELHLAYEERLAGLRAGAANE
jgi:D-alanine transaminase